MCARQASGQVLCWGNNAAGQLGDGTNDDSLVPVPALGLANAAAVFASASSACAVTTELDALCWGSNNIGQLGDGTRTNRNVPTRVSPAD
ncbi:MAG: hypothetical protein AB8I08_28545 [Sandaracinaceae bacterium]